MQHLRTLKKRNFVSLTSQTTGFLKILLSFSDYIGSFFRGRYLLNLRDLFFGAALGGKRSSYLQFRILQDDSKVFFLGLIATNASHFSSAS